MPLAIVISLNLFTIAEILSQSVLEGFENGRGTLVFEQGAVQLIFRERCSASCDV